MNGILGQLKWESLKKKRKDNRYILLYKDLKGKSSVPTDDLIPKTRRCRNQHSMAFQTPIAIIQMFIKVASSPRLSGIGMPSPILWSHLLKMQRFVWLSSLLWWELGTNSLITGPGEWLWFRRFTSKLSWSQILLAMLLLTLLKCVSLNILQNVVRSLLSAWGPFMLTWWHLYCLSLIVLSITERK